MTINSGDIKLVKSQVMDDVPEGGGAPTSQVIVDGNSNSIFNDISEVDRAGGRVNLRKVFATVQTPTVDGYYGANVIVADPFADPRVSATLVSTGSTFDTRDDAKSRIEAYLAPGPQWAGFLFENHIEGMRAIQLFQRTSDELPPIGKTLLLVDDEGLSTEKSQYVRVTDVSSVERTFTDTTGDYKANIVTCYLSDPLRYDFPGSPPTRYFTRTSTATATRDTVVADAATYYGVVPLVEEISIGALTAKASSIFTQLVPNAQTEIPIVNANAAGEYEAPIDSANGTISYTTSINFAPGTTVYLGVPIFPGTLSVGYSGGTLSDSAGDLMSGGTVVGVVDYAAGELRFAATSPTFAGSKTVTMRPAAIPASVSDTLGIPVTIESRSYNYVRTLTNIPAPGTLRVSYMAQGRWYTLRDNGAGVLRGADSAYGTGTVSYSTGSCVITLGALPDVGSSILFAFGTAAQFINRSGLTPSRPSAVLTLDNQGVSPGTVSITWNDGTARTAADDGKGALTGDATGSVDYAGGIINIAPVNLPAGAQSYSVTYSYGPPESDSFTYPWAPSGISATAVTITLTNTPVTEGSVRINWFVRTVAVDMGSLVVTGRRIDAYDDAGVIKRVGDNASIGTINYTTGVVQFETAAVIPARRATYTYFALGYYQTGAYISGYVDGTVSLSAVEPAATGSTPYQPINVTYLTSVGSPLTESHTAGSSLVVDITPTFAEPIVSDSVVFNLGGRRYFDKLGKLYYGIDVATGAATEAGTINYESGQVSISSWVPGQPATVGLVSLLTSMEERPVTSVSFRTPAAPVRPSSLQILGTLFDGTAVNATADADGDFTTDNIDGHIEYNTGVVNARFGKMVTAAGNEAEDWYDPDQVVGGQIFRPMPLKASTLRFNAVSYAYLPLDADLLGLDPVRLPQDGRVPIFRPGTFAVIGHTGTVGPATVSNGQTIDCARVRLARVRVVGANGVVINTGYTADLDTGLVTFTDVAGYSQPVTIEHRIEDMMLVSDAQINGDLTFTRPVTHAYPDTGAYVSSALVAGDVAARVSIVFDQPTWTSVWSDTAIGGNAEGTFNSILSPITVTNVGALTERWRVKFTNTTSFEVAGEHVGVIATGNTGTNCAPINPATGVPYFTIPAAGWGGGWTTGNVLRFNTVGAEVPVWVVRTIQQGPETVTDDSFTLLVRGDIDRP